MHGTFDRLAKNTDRDHRSWDVRVLAIPTLLGIAMVALLLTQPAASRWISEAAQAEFAASLVTPEPAPTQLAQPVNISRTVRSN